MWLAWLLATGCPKPGASPEPQVAVVEDGPQGVLDQLRVAVEQRDRDALMGCFAAQSAMRPRLEGPDVDWDRVWSELGGVLRGPQTLTLKGDWRAVPVGGDLRGRIDAPVAKGGGFGGLTFRRTADGWVILAW